MGEAVPLVVGVDGGGTSTRCLAATMDGEIVARGRAGGANPRSARDPGGNLIRALTEALAALPSPLSPAGVAGGVFGLAGSSESGRRQAGELARGAWRAAGLTGLPVVVPDIVVAFAGGTSAPDGGLLLSGTGAVAARMERRAIAHRYDGYGWLLGDKGSGFWIGRRAVQAALARLEGGGPPTVLTDRVLAALEDTPPGPDGRAAALRAEALIAAVYDHEPARLATLSPVVEAAAREGDPVALAILDEAARRLLATLEAVGPLGPGRPIVLAGSLLTGPTLVAERVRAALPGRDVSYSRDGAAGAAALALRAAWPGDGEDPRAEAAHRRLLAP
ncbi:N-acetylglucosamine kinase [Sphaerisporangium krabiense]|uniref:N-acetylglucosamine kinase-like BadF-type ATPase n=1 Tax=Sphaerisporangium krabiense TaxID=763782 RepID=A0A7W8ZBF9_9ACTN|nr:BadF/BadG/BcrA/BcrD ATPase family protein [Sphaerisporangium krabiense]MBB5630815.1 N-acetylglucosamine kinase-like BadF-type ATPase [Sphaerisporangium krabiense]GII65502.1 N-acetylglucosamine kinase [Sphaerisporangium krabiense]